MRIRPVSAVAGIVLASVAPAWSAEPLLGTWRLGHQEINGQETSSEPMILKVTKAGDKFAFLFSVPVNNIYFVSMSYTVKLDGSSADVKNAHGDKVGFIRITPNGPSQYKIVLNSPNRPDSDGKLTVSPDGKTLTSEAESMKDGRRIYSKQTFLRH
jgi:hypothetical protein